MFYPCKATRINLYDPLFVKLEYDYNWIAEPSMKGIRCLAHHHFNRIDLWARGERLITAPLIDLRRQIKALIPDGTVIDGVIFGPAKEKNNYFVFDIPILRNKETGMLASRYLILKTLPDKFPLITITTHQSARNKRPIFYESIKNPLVNGITIKDLSQTYPIGSKTHKLTDRWLVVVL
jgi:ATP-dependent DNA ligase